ncbi:Rho-type GTPase-activating protein 1 [Venturia nashicola]|uniref:Rho-type GTPase-activating protein 1 n=1 Tax=Venturia nashicola TaxID=86259 RepID=A0A4Z1NUM2_9PEZI|nr:Rho-type GTPase-activating protein 1 [Venturia nashicola]
MSNRDQYVQRQPIRSIDQESEFTVNVTVTKKASTRTKATNPTAGNENWHSAAPPRYDDISFDGRTLSERTARGGYRREWEDVASRIAARTAGARDATKRLSRNSSKRVQKSTRRKPTVGLSIDTGVTRHKGDNPLQVPLHGKYEQLADGPVVNESEQSKHIYVQSSTQAPTYSKHQPLDLGITLGSKLSPETPTILITPALENRTSDLPGFRGASSIYSRATSAPSHSTGNPSVPAFPNNLPYLLSKPQPSVSTAPNYNHENNQLHRQIRDFNAIAFEADAHGRKMGRHTSTATLFEEDQTPLTAGTPNIDASGHLTIDTTIPTPRRSRGWWDVIRTPFELSRSFSKFRSPTDGSRTPDVPKLPNNSFVAGRLQEKGFAVETEPGNLTRSQSHPDVPEKHKKQSLTEFLDLRHSKSEASLKLGIRATHNSQALRRLESNQQLPHVITKPMPAMKSHFSQDTEYTTFSPSAFSPDDREVPLVLGFNPASAIEQPKHPFKSDSEEAVGTQSKLVAPPIGQTISSPHQDSPQSASTTFSPVGQIAGVGTVPSAKAVVNGPAYPGGIQGAPSRGLQTSSPAPTSTRSSFTAQIVKQTPPMLHAPVYFAPPPVTASREPSPSRSRHRYEASPQYPQGRFSDSTIATEKPRKPKKQKVESRMQYFTLCGSKSKEKKNEGNGRDGKKLKKSKRKACCCCCCCFILLILTVVAVVVAVLLSKNKHQSTTSTLPSTSTSTFLNITNFPPIPTGALTIARPNLRTSVSGCVSPQAMWSCAVPKEQQEGILPNDPDQPNFAVTINHDNSSSISKLKARKAGSGASAASLWARSLLVVRDSFSSAAFPPSPAAPLLEEQAFLGNTTDNTVSPFEGEKTPFFMSFHVPTPASNSNAKRAAGSGTSTLVTDPSATTSGINIPTLTTAIPIPNINPDGTAQPANLLPFPSYQPLRLYNRGRPDEHYGFYTYFDRNIFLKSIKLSNSTQSYSQVPADKNGGSTFDGANVRCTWRDTRFKVQIWTNKGSSASLLPGASSTSMNPSGGDTFSRPGTFPYPITVSLDRHGGGLATKMLFCYALDAGGHIDVNSRQFQREDRAFGGELVNAAKGPFTSVNVTLAEGGPGGLDGGSGGCGCEWANWLAT